MDVNMDVNDQRPVAGVIVCVGIAVAAFLWGMKVCHKIMVAGSAAGDAMAALEELSTTSFVASSSVASSSVASPTSSSPVAPSVTPTATEPLPTVSSPVTAGSCSQGVPWVWLAFILFLVTIYGLKILSKRRAALAFVEELEACEELIAELEMNAGLKDATIDSLRQDKETLEAELVWEHAMFSQAAMDLADAKATIKRLEDVIAQSSPASPPLLALSALPLSTVEIEPQPEIDSAPVVDSAAMETGQPTPGPVSEPAAPASPPPPSSSGNDEQDLFAPPSHPERPIDNSLADTDLGATDLDEEAGATEDGGDGDGQEEEQRFGTKKRAMRWWGADLAWRLSMAQSEEERAAIVATSEAKKAARNQAKKKKKQQQ